jgi:MoaA/NifB/PqqE/SkfB family radical SAM enzyme
MLKVGNFIPALSIEGFEGETDMRRGSETFNKVIASMDLMKEAGILFGASICYHSNNTEIVASEKFFDFLIQKGVRFVWIFTYIPVGKDADTKLLATPEQRILMYNKIREYRKTKPLFTMDFWNDGEYVGGCIAGGRKFIHINSKGDVEPCAFIHYSTANIHSMSLYDALKQPLFIEFHNNQPFNQNMLLPCPALDNPDSIIKLVNRCNAWPTHGQCSEKVEDFASKCREASDRWTPIANVIWNNKKLLERKK